MKNAAACLNVITVLKLFVKERRMDKERSATLEAGRRKVRVKVNLIDFTFTSE